MCAVRSWVHCDKATTDDVKNPYTVDAQAALNVKECLNVRKKYINIDIELELQEQNHLNRKRLQGKHATCHMKKEGA
ncbi:hypothetical protein NDU88_004633 [Pleurodeles waltl]|uniref:Uncharacterized protein n=1 Tax=Pleurodeles waltl TaxID=8319 RepID=A0AAV7TT94_PLEWA|nr:hypothetical protein NDU88_004633 [Pleurodeles waltl]